MSDTVMCWRCGKPVPAGQVERRDVATGSSAGVGVAGGRLAAGHVRHGGRVSLCPRCAKRVDRDAADARRFWRDVLVILGGLFMLVALAAVLVAARAATR